jgi:hypothetical protein
MDQNDNGGHKWHYNVNLSIFIVNLVIFIAPHPCHLIHPLEASSKTKPSG